MTREEEINNASYAQFCNSSSVTFTLQKEAFEAGAKWADEHPVNIWHSPKEEPEDKEEDILHYSEYYNHWFINPLVYLLDCCYSSWSEAVEKESIKQWAYLKDLLPKGDEK